MRQNIAKWYKESGIFLPKQEQYEQRVDAIEAFLEVEDDFSVYMEMVKCFMGMDYDGEIFEGLVRNLTERDISFPNESERELALLAGIILKEQLGTNGDVRIAMMVALAHEEGRQPFNEDICRQILELMDDYRLDSRKNISLSGLAVEPWEDMDEDQKSSWDEGAAYISDVLGRQNGYNMQVDELLSKIIAQIKIGNEASDLLWWMVADWSELYDEALSGLDVKKAAIAVPFELMGYIGMFPGPIAIRRIIKKSLSKRKASCVLKSYIEGADEVVLARCTTKNMDLSLIEGFTPILQLLQNKSRFPKDMQTVLSLFEEKYEPSLLERKLSPWEFAYLLYLECELLEVHRRKENSDE